MITSLEVLHKLFLFPPQKKKHLPKKKNVLGAPLKIFRLPKKGPTLNPSLFEGQKITYALEVANPLCLALGVAVRTGWWWDAGGFPSWSFGETITSWWFQFNPFQKYAQVKLDHETPGIRGKNKKYMSCHHLDNHGEWFSNRPLE